MKFKGTGILVAALIGLFVVVLNRKELQIADKPTFTLVPIGNSGFELQSVIRLYNPNFLSSTVQVIHEDFRLNGHLIGVLKMQINQGIPGQKNTEFPMTIRFDRAAFYKAFPNDTLIKNGPVEIEALGDITFSNFTGGGTLPVNAKDTILVNL